LISTPIVSDESVYCPVCTSPGDESIDRLKRVCFGCAAVSLWVYHRRKVLSTSPWDSKAEVISLLGNPRGYTRNGDSETLQYPGGLVSGFSWDTADFFVVLKDGKVESYGSKNTQKANRSTVILVH
jgi:hypothetical protein